MPILPPCQAGKRVAISESSGSCKKRKVTIKTLPSNDFLCQRCVGIDIEDPTAVLGRLSNTYGPYLGDIESITTSTSCVLCQLLHSVHEPHHTRSKRFRRSVRYHLYAFESHRVFEARITATRIPEQVRTVLGVCRASQKCHQTAERQRCFAKGFIAPLQDQFSPPYQFQVQKVDKRAADFDQIRKWLNICLEKHSGTCTTKFRDPGAKLECIDVDNCDGMKPTAIGNNEKYLALSYVCAEAENVTLQQAGRGVILSQSIQDAMAVTRALGFRYLWIDAYCINQEDDEAKQAAIAKMDSIYEAATMTIIVAPSPDSPPGLPGISRERRMLEQIIAKVGRCTWTSTLPHLSAAISSTAWKTRGWTYQEAVLSTRCLYFTDVQVYFVCQCATACESLAILPNADLLSLVRSTFRSYAFDTDLTNRRAPRKGLAYFFQDLCNYKSRHLTYDNDSLNAFQGILERSDFKTVWGVPLIRHGEVNSSLGNSDLALRFVRGLWWENPGHLSYDRLLENHPHASFRRVPHFPSWSWCGWSGPITPHKVRSDINSDDMCNAVDATSPAIKIYFETECGSLKNPKQIMMNAAWRLSHTLRIITTFHVVRIRVPTTLHKMPYLCKCSLDTETCRVSHTKVHYVRMFRDPFAKDEPFGELFARTWHCIRLFTVKRCAETPDPVFAVFIIDWDGDREHFAQVIGVAYLDHDALDDGTREIIMLK